MNAALHEVEAERRPAVAVDIITAARRAWQRERRRPKALTARDALEALQFEILFAWTCAANLRNGETLSDADFERLTASVRSVNTICDEVL